MSKGTENFKNTIQARIEEMAEEDPLFAESLAKEDKTLDGCINYILSEVKRIGAQGYTDAEIFGLAAHYYDEDDLEEVDPVKMGVVVNHKPELSEEEKQELKEQVRKEELAKERARLHGKKSKPSKSNQNNEQSSLF